ncbi:hypothetical protein KY290_031017 [Solanum tuberosum]|uniref:Reverse transcriptase zinc-binding domain-containing protein n=1 Tax=Solanum tuberosum TaxID=4113 RepID=A0ABQ7U8T9_SOLTU|nr:hypothetical protein KY290_031017 [Solanum tuberosum]
MDPKHAPSKKYHLCPLNYGESDLKLVNLWDGNHWNWDKLSLSPPLEVKLVASSIVLYIEDHLLDTPYWSANSNGIFSTRSVYNSIDASDIVVFPHAWLWRIRSLNKIKFFLWLCAHERLPTTQYLHRLGIMPEALCPICHLAPEIVEHMFLQCPVAQKFWLDIVEHQSNPTAKSLASRL